MTQKLSKIKKLDLRTIWKNEAYEFTKWLSKKENLILLSEEIGVDLELVQTEAKAGKFNVDILAKEENSDRKIVIENQLEITDHDHLGKLITYASGHDANIVIWIFKDITDAHKQAIDWLNENTNEDFAFFGIKVEVWQIGNSPPAPKFHIISKPNEWAKILKQSRGSAKLTDTKLKQLDFWTKFKSFAQDKKKVSLRSPRPQHWFNVSVGSSDAHISLTINTRDKLLGCGLYISRNKDLFKYLKKRKRKIEKEVGMKLEFKEARVASRIIARYKGFDINNEKKLDEFFSWLLNNALLFRKVFGKYIKLYKKLPVLPAMVQI